MSKKPRIPYAPTRPALLVLLVSLVLPALAVLPGCGDPTADKPAATVSEATEEPGMPAAPGAPMSPASTDIDQPVQGTLMGLSPLTTIEFTGYKVTGSHDGGFKQFTGHVDLVDRDPTLSRVVVEIDTTSLWADNERLTGHLKSADFFDVEGFPTARFASTSIETAPDGRFIVTGNLTLHGITKSISFPADITADGNKVIASATFKLKRFEFDIAFKGMKDDLIDDDVVIRLNLIATRAAEQPAAA